MRSMGKELEINILENRSGFVELEVLTSLDEGSDEWIVVCWGQAQGYHIPCGYCDTIPQVEFDVELTGEAKDLSECEKNRILRLARKTLENELYSQRVWPRLDDCWDYDADV